MCSVVKIIVQAQAHQACVVSITGEPCAISVGVASVIIQVDRGMEKTYEIICKRIDVRSVIWDVVASNVTTSSVGSRVGRTRAVVHGACTLVAFGSFELDANVVDTKHERALKTILGDAFGVGSDVVKGSALRI